MSIHQLVSFIDQYKQSCHDMYLCLTSVSSTSISPGVQEWLQVMLQSQDPDVCFDLRHNNSGHPEKF